MLDDDIEHHNETEPTTSHCPFLPGQPVNVLQVPVLLPDSEPIHTHEGGVRDSLAFNTLDYRTMNPEDRYMNPRQPPKPKVARLRTSLEQPTPSWSFGSSPLSFITNRTTSQPSSPTSKSRSHNSKSSFGSKTSRSVSPPRSRGLRAALRNMNASTPNLTAANQVEDEHTAVRPAAAHGPRPQAICHRDSSPVDNEPELPFRRPSSGGHHESLTIQDRRALKLKSRDPSPFRNPLTVNTRSDRFETPFSQQNEVPSLRAIAQEIAVNGDSTTPTPFTFKDKRLPTLPNTPSSVMDEALEDLDAREKALDAENLGSHFSDFSATDESSGSHSPPCERSHFSEWSTDTDQIPMDSMVSTSSFNNVAERPPSPIIEEAESPDYLQPFHAAECSDPDTPHLTVNSQPSPAISMPSDSPGIPPPVPRLAIPESPSEPELDVSGLSIEDAAQVETNPKRHAAFFGAMDPVKGLGLTPSPGNSELYVPEAIQRDMAATPHASDDPEGQGQIAGQSAATMQEMMDELSYLKNMIQPGGMI